VPTMREEGGWGDAVEALCTPLLEFPINCIIHVITKGYRPVGLVNLCPPDRLCLSDLLLLDSASTGHTVMIVFSRPKRLCRFWEMAQFKPLQGQSIVTSS